MLAGRIADFYEAKLQRSLDRAIGVVGPLAIIVISVIVGGLIVSVIGSALGESDRRLGVGRMSSSVLLWLSTRRRSRNAKRGDGEGGFMLVMLVVITIIGLIMALVGPRVLNYLSEAKVKAAKI